MSNDTTKKLTAKEASEMTPWDIAAHYGVHYCGDMNPFDHDGYFYSTRDWVAWGYAETVDIWREHDEGERIVTVGTVNKPESMFDAFEYIGADYEDPNDRNNLCLQVESCEAYSGQEADDYTDSKTFTEEEEEQMWEHVLPILAQMGE